MELKLSWLGLGSEVQFILISKDKLRLRDQAT